MHASTANTQQVHSLSFTSSFQLYSSLLHPTSPIHILSPRNTAGEKSKCIGREETHLPQYYAGMAVWH